MTEGLVRSGTALAEMPLRTRLPNPYDRRRFRKVRNPEDGPSGKPDGGLWSSPLQAPSSVQDGQEPMSEWDLFYRFDEEDSPPPKGTEYEVQVRPDARIVVIDSWADYEEAVTRWPRDVPVWNFDTHNYDYVRGIDWAAMATDADGLCLTQKGCNGAAAYSRHHKDGMESMNGWDLPSTVFFRPDAVTLTARPSTGKNTIPRAA